jgi:glycosyltransferase involved in cell wall biosynthesis
MYLPFKTMAGRTRHLAMIPPPGRTPPMPSGEDLGGVDTFAAQRPVGPAGMRTWDSLDGVCARVYEVDDDLLTADPSALPHLTDPRVQDSIRYMLERSEMVTVSCPALAEKYERFNGNIVVLPNLINADLLDFTRRRGRPGRVTVGWAGGQSHLPDWAAHADTIAGVLARHKNTDMHFVGADYSPLLHHPCLWTGWTDDIWDYYRAVDFDIGLAPLADIPFNQSKSHLKALEYAALGVPVIASDLPPYRDFVIDGVTGYLVSTPGDWEKRLTELIGDRAARAEMGAAARRHAEQFTIQGHWRLWEKAYEEAAGHGG